MFIFSGHIVTSKQGIATYPDSVDKQPLASVMMVWSDRLGVLSTI